MPVPRFLLAAIVACVLVGTVWSAVHRDPWDPDETRYLTVAHELVTSGNPFFLTFDHRPYTDKPPLFFWVLAPLVLVLGSTSALAGMLPSLLAWLGIGLATRRLARAAGLPMDAVRWSPLAAMSALLPAVVAGGCRMDMLFALWTTLALERLARLAHPRRATRRDHVLFWVWTALAVLTKGPLALVFPLLAALATGRPGRGLLGRMFRGWGPLVAVAMVGAWLVPAALIGGREWLQTILIHQSAGRVLQSFAHRSPWWYHLATVPLTLMPWSLLALVGSIGLLFQPDVVPGGGRLVAVYPVAGLLFLSLLSGKTFLYPLPLFPAACVVAVWWLTRAPRRPARRLALAFSALLPLALGAGLVLFVAPRPDMALPPWSRVMLGAGLIVPSLFAVFAAGAARTREAAAALVLTVPLFVLAGLPQLVPPFDRLLSLRPFAAAYAAADPAPDRPGLAYGKLQPGFVLFTGRPFRLLTDEAGLARALAAGRAVAIDVKEARRVRRVTGLQWAVRASVPYRHSRILIIGAATPADRSSGRPETAGAAAPASPAADL